MHRGLTRVLYDLYPLHNKNDRFPTHLYFKHVEHFVYHALQAAGLPTKQPAEKLEEGPEEMMKAYVEQIAEAAPSADTNMYHSKVVELRDAIQLVTLKEHLMLNPPERVLPYRVARDIVLRGNDIIAVGTCMCRLLSLNPCLPQPHEICILVFMVKGDVGSHLNSTSRNWRSSSASR